MQHHEIHIRLGFAGVQAADKEQSMASLAQRKDQLVSIISESLEDPEKPRNIDAEDVAWLARSYPVLAILSPVMATHEGKIEFPGDPMCLYSALSVAIDQAVKAKEAGLVKESPYNDLCPRWGSYLRRNIVSKQVTVELEITLVSCLIQIRLFLIPGFGTTKSEAILLNMF